MKVLHITAGLPNSGSFKGVYLLHKYLLKKGIRSTIINDSPESTENNLRKIKFVNKNFISNLYLNLLYFFDRFPKVFFFFRKATSFSTGFVGYDITKLSEFKNADIIHLHWINKGFFNIADIAKINKPVVWTLRDMWPFTGGCHYTLNCNKFKKTCGMCPQLGSGFKYDLSFFLQKRKKNFLKKNIYFVAISRWLKNQANRSSILKKKRIEVIHNGIDPKYFFPVSKQKLRNKYNLPKDKKIILFGSQYINSSYKGYRYFIDAFKYLNNKNYFIVLFGNMWDFSQIISSKVNFKHYGFIENVKFLREIYSLSDVFVMPSVQEGFGKTAVESMLCGTPVVCFKNTAISEIVIHKKNGYCANYLNSKSLSKGIKWVLKDSKKISKIRKSSRTMVKRNFNSNLMSNKYIKLYRTILKAESSNDQ